MFFKKKKKEPENIGEILASFDDLKRKVKDLETEIEEMRKKTIQGIGVVRFNPFSDIGGDQSFSIAILDGDRNGVVITGFYSREGSNVYSKAIKEGNSNYPLIKEEKDAIEIAISKKEV